MKQRLFKVLFVCMAGAFLPQVAQAGDVEINATNFPDENFRNYLLEQDYGKDGKLTEEEIKDIGYLDVIDREIRSLQGIEHFTELEMLQCGFNQLTTLDVSKNIALTELYCTYNFELTALDVSKNIALAELDCSYSRLTSLDVSGCTNLNRLDCGYNQLTSLDVSKNTALISLSCGGNPLTTLDVSKNTALTSLDCGYNQLTSLDVSKNTKLTKLNCFLNQIKGASMDNLINSLPIQEKAWLYVYHSFSSNEGNVCTKKQVKAAKEKGWRVYYKYDDYNWREYEGSDDTSSNIDSIRMEADKDAPVYNLRGERLTAPQKGVNIIGGRKVVVK